MLVERNGAEQQINLPIDLIDKLLKGEKKPFIDWREPFMVGKVSDSSENNQVLIPKDVIKSLNGIETKYADQVVAIAKENKDKTKITILLM